MVHVRIVPKEEAQVTRKAKEPGVRRQLELGEGMLGVVAGGRHPGDWGLNGLTLLDLSFDTEKLGGSSKSQPDRTGHRSG